MQREIRRIMAPFPDQFFTFIRSISTWRWLVLGMLRSVNGRYMFARSWLTNFSKIFLIAFIGAVAGQWFTLPLAGMFLAAIGVIVLRKRFDSVVFIPKTLLMSIQMVLGISVGATITVGELSQKLSLPVIIGLIICLILQTSSSFWWLHKREGWTPFESLLAAVPGAMAAILVISESDSKPSAKVVYAHSVRIIILIVLAGMVSGQADEVVSNQAGLTFAQWGQLAAILGASMLCGKLSVKFSVPAPYMITSLIIAAISNQLMAPATLVVPIWLVLLATALLGVLIGSRLAETTLREALAYSRAGVFVTLIGLSVALLTSFVASLVLDIPWVVLLLSWVPGSVEAMTAVALLMGLEPAFVMVNHAMRMLLLYTLPVILKNQLEQLRRS